MGSSEQLVLTNQVNTATDTVGPNSSQGGGPGVDDLLQGSGALLGGEAVVARSVADPHAEAVRGAGCADCVRGRRSGSEHEG